MDKEHSCCKILISKKQIFTITFFIWFFLAVFLFVSKGTVLNGFDLFVKVDNYSFLRYLSEICVYLCGNLVIFILPGLFWVYMFANKDAGFLELSFFSFLVSVFLFIVATTIYKLFLQAELNWHNFLLIIIFTTLLGLIALIFQRREYARMFMFDTINFYVVSLMIIAGVLCFWIYYEKIVNVIFDNNFSPEHIAAIPLGMQDDVMEHFGLVDSLKKFVLPYWDLEYAEGFGYSVIDPPFQKFTSLFLVLMFGQSFVVQGLNFLIVTLLTFVFSWKISGFGHERKKHTNAGFFLPFLLTSYVLVIMYSREFAVPLFNTISFLCFFTIGQMYFLLKKRYILFLLFALLAFLTKFEAFFFNS